MKKVLFSLVAMLFLSLSGIAQTTFAKVTSASELEPGANYLIVAHHDDFGALAMGYQKSNNRNAVVVTESGDAITVTLGTDPNSSTDVFQFTLGGNAGAWTLFDEVKGGYLYAASSSGNQLKTQTTLDANGEWNITFNNDGTAEVVAQGENTRNNMRFNPFSVAIPRHPTLIRVSASIRLAVHLSRPLLHVPILPTLRSVMSMVLM